MTLFFENHSAHSAKIKAAQASFFTGFLLCRVSALSIVKSKKVRPVHLSRVH
jgi:hypothetical protein